MKSVSMPMIEKKPKPILYVSRLFVSNLFEIQSQLCGVM